MNHIILTAAPLAENLLQWILSAILLGLLYFTFKKMTAKPKTTGEQSTPVHVKMEDHFVTRREFDGLRTTLAHDITKLDGMQQRTFDKMDERDQRLTDVIESVAKAAVAGRLRIHEDIKFMRDRVVRCETKLESSDKSQT